MSVAIKPACGAARPANIVLYGEQNVDGVAVEGGDRVLVKDQTLGYENGIYVANVGQWQRAKDFSDGNDVRQGTLVVIASGDINGGVAYEVNTPDPIIIGTSLIAVIQFILGAGFPPHVADRATLKAIDTNKNQTVSFDGNFWDQVAYSSVSALIAIDTLEAVLCRSTFNTPIVWVRRVGYNVGPTNVRWFGAIGDGIAGDTAETRSE